MTTEIIITVCSLLILAYLFDVTSAKTKIPPVILLLLVGWAFSQGIHFFGIEIPDMTPILPIFGTIGLILIVLEGSLELEFHVSKIGFIAKSLIIAFVPILVFSFGLAYTFEYFGNVPLKIGLANAIPLAVISSSIAIPSAQNLIHSQREFITYESSLSDIFGVIFFNFVTLNDSIGAHTFNNFVVEMLIILVVSFVATLVLAFLLSRIKHPVKFMPIILMIIMIYTVAKIFHLPGLVFILLFGLFLGNLDELKSFKFIEKFRPDILNLEVVKFKELTTEVVFLVRAIFFLLFGYLIETEELLNPNTVVWALSITAGIFVLRFVLLKVFRMKLNPLLYIAPRGLITILLFLSIPENQVIDLVDKSLIIQVIIFSALIMMFGLMINKKEPEQSDETPPEDLPVQEDLEPRPEI